MGKLLHFPVSKVQKCVFCSQYHEVSFDCMAKVYTLALLFSDDVDKIKLFDSLSEVEKNTLELCLVPMPDND